MLIGPAGFRTGEGKPEGAGSPEQSSASEGIPLASSRASGGYTERSHLPMMALMASVTLYHGTTTDVVPRGSVPFELLPSSAHEGPCIWPEHVAPRHLIYLGDMVSLVFAERACKKHGGWPVLLEVDVEIEDLQPDPAYLVGREGLGLIGFQLSAFGTDVASSLHWSGRVAISEPVTPRARYVCRDLSRFQSRLKASGLAQQATYWHEERVWRHFALSAGLRCADGADFRLQASKKLVSACFRRYY